MSTCPFPHAATATPPEAMPARIAALPTLRGYPVPWFVDKVNGEYDFRVMDGRKLVRAVKESLCWTCGGKLGKFKTFILGPMCGINRTISEPPSHQECARYSARHCPFLSMPHMKRREKGMPEEAQCAGVGLKRNPGAVCLWTIKSYKPFSDGRGGVLFTFPDPESVEWFAEGRRATRAEVERSIETGLPHLRGACDQEATPELCADAHKALDQHIAAFQKYLPAE